MPRASAPYSTGVATVSVVVVGVGTTETESTRRFWDGWRVQVNVYVVEPEAV